MGKIWRHPEVWKLSELEPEYQVPEELLIFGDLGEGAQVHLLECLVLLVDAENALDTASD